MSESRKYLKIFLKNAELGTEIALSLSLSLSLKTHLNLLKKIYPKNFRIFTHAKARRRKVNKRFSLRPLRSWRLGVNSLKRTLEGSAAKAALTHAREKRRDNGVDTVIATISTPANVTTTIIRNCRL